LLSPLLQAQIVKKKKTVHKEGIRLLLAALKQVRRN
jgi:hypothetical protein